MTSDENDASIDETSKISDKTLFKPISFTQPSPQHYLGHTLNTTLHGRGLYLYQNQNEKIFYDGWFYANQLEGYGQVFYQDSSNFQGLFINNKRFGPGIFTYPNGERDVGWWRGFKLLRLATSDLICGIPQLASSWLGKMQLLRYRHMVQVCQPSEDLATTIMHSLGAEETLMQHTQKLYSEVVVNTDSALFNKKLYDEQFFLEPRCTIEVLDPLFYGNDDYTEIQLDEAQTKLKNRRLAISGLLSEKISEIRRTLDRLYSEIFDLTTRINYCKACCYYASPVDSEPSIDNDDVTLSDKGSDASKRSTISTLILDNYDLPVSRLSSKSTLASPMEAIAGDPCFCDETFDIEDLAQMERDLEIKSRLESFWNTIQSNLERKLEIIRAKLETPPRRTKKVFVSEILAWNNEEFMMDALKQCFVYREFDGEVEFDIYSLLTGQRQKYEAAGSYEKHCLAFLGECTGGDTLTIIDYIRRRNVDVNVADGLGNTGVFYAAAKGRHDVIRVLANFGANLNQINDEGLTPLNLSILLYISARYNIEDWEASFLPEVNPADLDDELQTWQPRSSTKSMSGAQRHKRSTMASSRSEKLLSTIKSKTFIKKIPYIFDTNFGADPFSNVKSTETIRTERLSTKPKEFLYMGLEMIENTISCLLDAGADPNIGEVPFPALILASYCGNEQIVREILEAQADVNVLMRDKGLNCLHLICSSRCCEQNIQICYSLLEFYCDCNARAGTSHWSDRKSVILGKGINDEDIEDEGKNPLHVLCMRKDYQSDTCEFFSKVTRALIEFQVNLEDTYLGHTPLSLAVLSGNMTLVTVLLESGLVDPYGLLQYDMGNILTLFFLKRYEGLLPLEECKAIMSHVVSLEVNPLKPVGSSRSAVEFAEKELGLFNDRKDKKGNTPKLPKDSPVVALLEHLKNLARLMVLRSVQMSATKILYNLAEEKLLNEECAKTLARFLTPDVAFEDIQLLFSNMKIEDDRYAKDICLDVIEFVDQNKIVTKQNIKKTPSTRKAIRAQFEETVLDIRQKFADLIEATSFHPKPIAEIVAVKLVHPGLDESFDTCVCFQCLGYSNLNLQLCPICQMIYFCSEKCMKLNQKLKFGHNCDSKEHPATNINLNELFSKVEDSCIERMMMRRKERMEEELRNEEEERKKDVYGTRVLKQRKGTLDQCQISTKELKSFEPRTIDDKIRLTQTSFKPDVSLFTVHLDGKLRRLSSLEESYRRMLGRKSTLSRLLPQRSSTDTTNVKSKSILEKGAKPAQSETVVESKFERLPDMEERCVVHKKVKKFPKKPRMFMDLLGKYFPDVDLSYMVLPFVCCSDGQIYYRFSQDNALGNTYSAM